MVTNRNRHNKSSKRDSNRALRFFFDFKLPFAHSWLIVNTYVLAIKRLKLVDWLEVVAAAV